MKAKPNFIKENVHYCLMCNGNCKQFPNMKSLISYYRRFKKLFSEFDASVSIYRVHVYSLSNFKNLIENV